MMCRVSFVVFVLALLYCCSCVFAVEEEQEPQVTQVNAVCAGDGNVARWQLRGKSLWYNCTDAATGAGKMICGMGVGNCAPEDVKKRIKGGVKDAVITINVSTFTPDILERWWERNVEDVTVAIVPAKPPAALTPGPQEHKAPGDATKKNSESSPAVVENSTDVPPPPPPATPGGTGANSAAGAAATTDPSAAASQASDPAPSGDPQGAARSASAASPAPESIPDPEPTEDGHFSHDPPVELREETAAAPPTQLSQTGEDGGAAGGTEEDTAANATDTASSEGNSTAASMPAPLSPAPKKNALENSVGTDACFHDTRLHALPPLVLAALTYGTLG